MTLYVPSAISLSRVLPIHQPAYIREARANLADVANLTHFPTLTNTARVDRTWSVSAAQDEYDNTDPTEGSHHLPVRVRSPPPFPFMSEQEE